MWVAMVSLALSLMYSLLFVAKFFGESFFVLHQRSMVQYAVSGVLVSENLDPFIWGASIVLVSAWLLLGLYSNRGKGRLHVLLVLVSCVLVGLSGLGLFGVLPLVLASGLLVVLSTFLSRSCFGVSRLSAGKSLVIGVVLVFVFVELAGLVLFNAPAVLNLDPQLSGVAVHWRLVELSFSNLAYPFLPYAYLCFIVLGVVAFVAKVSLTASFSEKFRGKRFIQFASRFKEVIESCKGQECDPLSGRFPLVLAILISFVVSSLLVVITVLPWINPTYRVVSVDAAFYYPRVVHMRLLDANSALTWAFGTDRPVFFVFLTLASFVVPLLHLVQFFPALLIPMFCIVSVLVLRLFCRLREALVYTALLAPFSVPALGLIYSGYFANMLAVILVYVYFILLVKVVRVWSSLGFFGLLGVSVLILFTHLGTWFVFAVSLGAFLFLEWRLAVRDRGLWQGFKVKATFVGVTVVVGLVCDFVRQTLFPFSTLAFVSQSVSSSFGFPNGAFILNGLRVTTDFHLGGVFANQLLIVLSIVGFLFMLSFKSEVSNFLVSWVFVASVYMLFASGEYVFNRFLFMMPSAVLSGLGLFFIVRLGAYRSKGLRVPKFGVAVLVLVFVLLVLVNGGLRYVLNLNAV